jgi:hypothetical protein
MNDFPSQLPRRKLLLQVMNQYFLIELLHFIDGIEIFITVNDP